MPPWLQHILVLSLAATCLFVAVRQGIRSLRGKGTGIGSCCARGCLAQVPSKRQTERLVFLPSDMLRRR